MGENTGNQFGVEGTPPNEACLHQKRQRPFLPPDARRARREREEELTRLGLAELIEQGWTQDGSYETPLISGRE